MTDTKGSTTIFLKIEMNSAILKNCIILIYSLAIMSCDASKEGHNTNYLARRMSESMLQDYYINITSCDLDIYEMKKHDYIKIIEIINLCNKNNNTKCAHLYNGNCVELPTIKTGLKYKSHELFAWAPIELTKYNSHGINGNDKYFAALATNGDVIIIDEKYVVKYLLNKNEIIIIRDIK